MWQETQLSSVNPAQLSDCNSRHMASLLLLQLASVSFAQPHQPLGQGAKSHAPAPGWSKRKRQKTSPASLRDVASPWFNRIPSMAPAICLLSPQFLHVGLSMRSTVFGGWSAPGLSDNAK